MVGIEAELTEAAVPMAVLPPAVYACTLKFAEPGGECIFHRTVVRMVFTVASEGRLKPKFPKAMLLVEEVAGVVMASLLSEAVATAVARLEVVVDPAVVAHVPTTLEEAEGPLPPELGRVVMGLPPL